MVGLEVGFHLIGDEYPLAFFSHSKSCILLGVVGMEA